MKPLKLDEASRGKIAHLVRNRYAAYKDYRKSYRLMSGMNFDSWCDSIDMMMRKEHEPAELDAIPGLARYFGIGVTRMDATVSWRQDLLLNTAEAPFSLKPTPIPTMAPEVVAKVKEQILTELWTRLGNQIPVEQLVAAGQPIEEIRRYIEQQAPRMKRTEAEYLNRAALRDASDAELLIKDLAIEGGWRKCFWEMQRTQTMYPVAVMCGPELVATSLKKYGQNGAVLRKAGISQQWRMVDAREFYFGTDSTNANDGSGCIEIRYRSFGELTQCLTDKYYDSSAIQKVLDEFEQSSRKWLAEGYQDSASAESSRWSENSDEQIPVLIHHGQLSGRELLDAGITGVDSNKLYESRVEVIGSHTIYCELALFQQGDGAAGHSHLARPYYSTSWKVVDGSPYGRSLGMLLRDPQLILNRLHYYMMANAYNAHLPMTEVSSARLESPLDWFYQPGGSFDVASEAKIEGETSALRFHQTPSTFQGLYNLFVGRMKMIDDEIGITAVSYGSMLMTPDDKTLGGQLQRISGSARGLKDAIYNQDVQVIEPSIGRSVAILQAQKAITGDVNVVARGAASLIQRDVVQSQQKETLPILVAAAQRDPQKYAAALDALLVEIFSSGGVPRDLLPDSSLEKEFLSAGLEGSPATPQITADGRSMSADQLGATL